MRNLVGRIFGISIVIFYTFSHYIFEEDIKLHDLVYYAILLIIGWIVGKLFDDYKAINNRLIKKEQLFNNLFYKNQAKIIIINPQNGKIIDANDAACSFYGYEKEIFKSKKIWEINTLSKDQIMESFKSTLEKQNEIKYFQHRLADGKIKYVEIYRALASLNHQRYIVSIINDITESKSAAEKIKYLFNHDLLTDLPNRNALHKYVENILSYSSSSFSILFIDINRFKWFNSTIGNHFGDLLLKEVSSIIKVQSPEDSYISRYGDDEFIVVVETIKEQKVEEVIYNLLKAFDQALYIEGREIFVSLSIGISQYPQDSKEQEVLLKNAETAMFVAKKQKLNYLFYSPELEDEFSRKMNLENELRVAIKNNEFLLHYQPQIDLFSNTIVGYEALIRWQHPNLGLIAPLKFIPLAEETGLIHPVGQWVLEEACRQNKKWHENGFPLVPVAVNVSLKQLEDTSFVTKVSEILEKTGLEAKYLDIEITESIMQNDDTIAKLVQLKDLGVKLSIDDFGTGYSSLGLLKNLPVDKIKVDKRFIKNIESDQKATALIKTIIDMGKHLNVDILTEGIEQENDVAFLKKLSCQLGQGYFFSKSLSVNELMQYLKGDI